MDMINATHYCWSIGNTGFRENALYQKIEGYLQVLDKFNSEGNTWSTESQLIFYHMMQEHGFMENGSTSDQNMRKAARLKTAPLVDLGLTDDKRVISTVGNEILRRSIIRSENPKERFDKEYLLDNDGDIYIKQLIKLQHFSDEDGVKPFILFLTYLKEFGYLSFDEIAYVLPLIVESSMIDYGKELIKNYRIEKTKKTFSSYAWAYKTINSHKNRIKWITDLKESAVGKCADIQISLNMGDREAIENFLIEIDKNGKSKEYSIKLYELFVSLYAIFADQSNNYNLAKYIPKSIDKTSSPQRLEWRNVIFESRSTKYNNIKDYMCQSVYEVIKIKLGATIEEFIANFFDMLWFVKIYNNLHDYADHNLRYLKLSNILETTIVEREFRVSISAIYDILIVKILQDESSTMFVSDNEEYNNSITSNTSYTLPPLDELALKEIAQTIILKSNEFGKKKEMEDKPTNKTWAEWIGQLKNELAENRIINLIETERSKIKTLESNNLCNCLSLVEDRCLANDRELQKIIKSEADVPTIMEYMVWISFLILGDYKDNPLEFANFGLDNDLKPVQHAGGGMADIIFKYDDHDLVIEATLANEEGQRRLEIEPVPRHLGRYKLKENSNSYGIFIAPFIDRNVAMVFRNYRFMEYYFDNMEVKMDILPLSVNLLKRIVTESAMTGRMYSSFKDNNFQPLIDSETQNGVKWFENEVVNAF